MLHYSCFQGSNNQVTFHNFLVNLKQKCEGRKVIVVQDNLSVHKTALAKSLYTGDFEQLFLPPYSCELNPIETVWSLVKGKYRRTVHLLREPYKTEKQLFLETISLICKIVDDLDPLKLDRISKCNFKPMAKALRGNLV